METNLTNEVTRSTLEEHYQALATLLEMTDKLEASVTYMRRVITNGGKIFTCGNGGSAADAQHFASELTGRFEKNRQGYAAIALTTDSSSLTAIGNDFGFEFIFSRQLQALAQTGDLLFAISTSGNSANVVQAVNYARSNDVYSIGLLGRDGGKLAELVDLPLIVPVERTARVQEAHIFILHLLCELLESDL
jgi:D-sedoheptulose 7-phosphate isomerase